MDDSQEKFPSPPISYEDFRHLSEFTFLPSSSWTGSVYEIRKSHFARLFFEKATNLSIDVKFDGLSPLAFAISQNNLHGIKVLFDYIQKRYPSRCINQTFFHWNLGHCSYLDFAVHQNKSPFVVSFLATQGVVCIKPTIVDLVLKILLCNFSFYLAWFLILFLYKNRFPKTRGNSTPTTDLKKRPQNSFFGPPPPCLPDYSHLCPSPSTPNDFTTKKIFYTNF